MMNSHDKSKDVNESVITERGQVSVPVKLRRAMGIQPGQKLHWEQVSNREIRVSIRVETPPGPLSVLGYAKKIFSRPPRSTADWMKELREGE
jgi:bifunctional DNA-binding transcriptional regulator/antitoxin component of YhaV-PrlF toxin-antitoxin module